MIGNVDLGTWRPKSWGPPPWKIGDQKRVGEILDNSKLGSRISRERIKISKIGQRCDQERFLQRWC